MNTNNDLKALLIKVLSKVTSTVTTDWLSYCIEKNRKFVSLDEKTLIEKYSIKSGIPAVGSISIIDNDFFDLQNDDWKSQYKLLDNRNFTVCISEVKDVKFFDNENVEVIKQQTVVQFDDSDLK